MFSPIGLFKKTPCPEDPRCPLNNCLFAHDPAKSEDDGSKSRNNSGPHLLAIEDSIDGADGPRKKRRLNVDPDTINANGYQTTAKNTPEIKTPPLLNISGQPISVTQTKTTENSLPRSALRRISPPPRRIAKDTSTKPVCFENEQPSARTVVQNEKGTLAPRVPTVKAALPNAQALAESLNPRLLPNPPVSHAIRMKLVTMLHEQMLRLNDEVRSSQDSSDDVLLLSDQQLIAEALEEEFQAATKNPAVYQNVIKSRIMVLRKTKLDVWKSERVKKLGQRQAPTGDQKPSPPKTIDTSLTQSEEIVFLPRLAADQEGLSKHGYVTAIPTAAELESARKGVESAQGWELCDRCKTRFQVFPGRREEDGALTSGGNCIYHWAKPRRPDMVKGDVKPRDLKYACCDEIVGVSAGCTKADSHVFKISDPKRLALVMPFKSTPASDRTDVPGAVCFDCEMGYSTLGMELIRLTATAWPDGSELLDVLVRPIGEVLDLNSRFSGVWPEDWANASPFDEDRAQSSTDFVRSLKIVESPAKARDLLFELLTPQTPLIGHALENDLNATRILHPVIVDTCLIYPHHRGLPVRFGLKVLMKKHLDRDIQMGGSQGHDSKEDARAAGDLVRYRIRSMWQKMKGEGWSTRDGEFFPPLPPDA
ncbi:MAG: hypothetical protein Q9185_002755 [Variospora sp. 1 TL-2023]